MRTSGQRRWSTIDLYSQLLDLLIWRTHERISIIRMFRVTEEPNLEEAACDAVWKNAVYCTDSLLIIGTIHVLNWQSFNKFINCLCQFPTLHCMLCILLLKRYECAGIHFRAGSTNAVILVLFFFHFNHFSCVWDLLEFIISLSFWMLY